MLGNILTVLIGLCEELDLRNTSIDRSQEPLFAAEVWELQMEALSCHWRTLLCAAEVRELQMEASWQLWAQAEQFS